MRRNLASEQLGDLFERPLNAVIAIHRPDGEMLQTPVWHRWQDGGFVFQIPAGDRKIDFLRADPRISLILAENEYPYRAISVRGIAALTSDGYHEEGRAICARYVAAYHPGASVDAYMSDEPGVLVRVSAQSVRAWDYADESFV